MDQKELKLYIYNDDICFSVDQDRKVQFFCRKHRTQLVIERDGSDYVSFVCATCEAEYPYSSIDLDISYQLLEKKVLMMYDSLKLKNAKLVRLDDYYVPELKIKNLMDEKSPYFVKGDVKTDKDGDTIVVLYVGLKGDKKKAQFFIKPEKLQLSHDFKDLDPSKVLAKIELTLRDRIITQKYNEINSIPHD